MLLLGHSTGVVDGILAVPGIPYQVVTPAKWKAASATPANKPLVLHTTRRRWLDAPLARVKDRGRAEALFLAALAAPSTHA